VLVLIDESGDCGMKAKKGTSSFFIVTAVIFEENEEAEGCDARIGRLRGELKLHERFEFKFNKCNHVLRKRFLEATSPYGYFYSAMIINKAKLYGPGFQYKEPFYKYATSLVFENCKPLLREAKVIVDKCGNRIFREQLANYLKKKINPRGQASLIRKVRMEDSRSNNLLQLVDMVCGAVARCYTDRKDKDGFREIIRHS
jgi:hypothetical protein